jgi:hypothetical protein
VVTNRVVAIKGVVSKVLPTVDIKVVVEVITKEEVAIIEIISHSVEIVEEVEITTTTMTIVVLHVTTIMAHKTSPIVATSGIKAEIKDVIWEETKSLYGAVIVPELGKTLRIENQRIGRSKGSATSAWSRNCSVDRSPASTSKNMTTFL